MNGSLIKADESTPRPFADTKTVSEGHRYPANYTGNT